ncbi:MAG TPA: PhnD/SsuA/transferrin family substrate-binding protein [Dissulfurispiraceae bacterium]|nr:PhnD/SsuA/transferrin family substrate-binding protein [Dissulfurispiraceae bacterium]
MSSANKMAVALAVTFGLLAAETAALSDSEHGRLNIGYTSAFFADVNSKDAEAAFDLWTKEMGTREGWVTNASIYNRIERLAADFNSRKLDLAVVKTLDYIKMRHSLPGTLGFTLAHNGKSTVRYVLLTREDAKVRDIRDLKGKRLSVIKGDETSILFLDTYLLEKRQAETKDFFADVTEHIKPSQAILSVFFGQNDASLVMEDTFNTMAELNPQIRQKLRVSAASNELVTSLNLFRKDWPESKKRRVMDIAEGLKDNPRGRQILMLFKCDGVTRVKEEDLASMNDLVATYNRLKAGRH